MHRYLKRIDNNKSLKEDIDPDTGDKICRVNFMDFPRSVSDFSVNDLQNFISGLVELIVPNALLDDSNIEKFTRRILSDPDHYESLEKECKYVAQWSIPAEIEHQVDSIKFSEMASSAIDGETDAILQIAVDSVDEQIKTKDEFVKEIDELHTRISAIETLLNIQIGKNASIE